VKYFLYIYIHASFAWRKITIKYPKTHLILPCKRHN
jgi:hypothetical protein